MHKTLIFLLTGVAIVMSLTFAAFLVLTKFSAITEIQRMQYAMSELTQVRHDTGVSWSLKKGGQQENTTLFSSGQISRSEDFEPSYNTTFRVLKFNKGKEYSDYSGEVKLVDGETFLTYESPGPNIENISFSTPGTWVKFRAGEFSSWGEVLPGVTYPIETVISDAPWDAEGVRLMLELVGIADVLHVSHDDLTELVHGVNTRIIDAQLDEDATKTFLLESIRRKEGREPVDAERIQVVHAAEQYARLRIKLWIGIKDHLLYRVQAYGGLVQKGTKEVSPVDLRIEFSEFNGQSVVQAPTRHVSFAELYQQKFSKLPSAGTSLSGGKSHVTLVDRGSVGLPVEKISGGNDPDKDGLSNVLETFYGTDPTNPDTDGDGVSDGEEVSVSRNPRGSGSLFSFGLGG